MKLICFLTLLILFIPQKKLHAQTDTVSYYFDQHFNVINKDSATYQAFAEKETNTNLWNAAIINIVTKDTIIKGYYNDSLFSTPIGKFEIYSDNGVKQEEGSYKEGKKQGIWFTWDDNAHLTDSAFYENGEGILRNAYTYDGKGNLISVLHEDKNLNKSVRVEYESGVKRSEVTNMLNDHIIETKIFYDNGQLRTNFVQKKGRVTSSKYYDEKGNELTAKEYQKRNESTEVKIVIPEFPGGIDKFMSYITSALKRNNSLRYETGTLKELTIIFYLDKNGKPYSIKLSTPESTELTETIINAMNNMPHWDMNGLENFGPLYRTLKYIL